MIGVPVWSRTKKRSFGVVKPRAATASQRISALLPKLTNHSGGSRFAIGEPFSVVAARATGDGEAYPAIPSATGSDAPSFTRSRRLNPRSWRRRSLRLASYSTSCMVSFPPLSTYSIEKIYL